MNQTVSYHMAIRLRSYYMVQIKLGKYSVTSQNVLAFAGKYMVRALTSTSFDLLVRVFGVHCHSKIILGTLFVDFQGYCIMRWLTWMRILECWYVPLETCHLSVLYNRHFQLLCTAELISVCNCF